MDMDGVTARLARIATKRTCRLAHRGRKSGRPFEVTIWFLVDADIMKGLQVDCPWFSHV